MDSMCVSDEYVDVFVAVLTHLRGVAGLDTAMCSYAETFLSVGSPFVADPTPDPTQDYDAFCRSLKDGRRRTNATSALVKLGFGAMAAKRVHEALGVIRDPSPDTNKALAIHFVTCALPHATNKEDIMQQVHEIVRNQAAYGLPARTRFAMMDLGNAQVHAMPKCTQVAGHKAGAEHTKW